MVYNKRVYSLSSFYPSLIFFLQAGRSSARERTSSSWAKLVELSKEPSWMIASLELQETTRSSHEAEMMSSSRAEERIWSTAEQEMQVTIWAQLVFFLSILIMVMDRLDLSNWIELANSLDRVLVSSLDLSGLHLWWGTSWHIVRRIWWRSHLRYDD